jgi:hypothetical protein
MSDDSQNKCEPAYSMIRRLGGPSEVARAIQQHAIGPEGDRRTRALNPSTVCRWSASVTDGGTGGVIPIKYWPALVKIARAKGHEITIADLSERIAQAMAGVTEGTTS